MKLLLSAMLAVALVSAPGAAAASSSGHHRTGKTTSACEAKSSKKTAKKKKASGARPCAKAITKAKAKPKTTSKPKARPTKRPTPAGQAHVTPPAAPAAPTPTQMPTVTQAPTPAGQPSAVPTTGASVLPTTPVTDAAVAVAAGQPATRQNNVPVPTAGAYLGILSYIPNLTNMQSVAQREQQFSRRFAVDSHYYDWTDTFPTRAETADVAAGRTPMITWWGTAYATINNGSQDAVIRRAARAVKAFDKPVFLRWAAEMNGDWFAWGGAANGNNPAGFVTAWHRVHDIFQQEGVQNVSWVWAPNADSSPGGTDTSSWNNWRNYYPGDSYVDWVGIDGYNWGTNLCASCWQSPDSIMGPVYRDYAARKPIMIAETSSSETGGNKAQWVGSLGSWVKSHSAVKTVIWFDRTYTSTGHDWAIDTSSAARSAFGQLAADPFFAAKP